MLRRQSAEPPERPLTGAEKALALSVFGDAIELNSVTIRRRKWWPLQPRNIVMAPNGHIWFHPRCPFYCDDFSQAPLNWQALLIHELTHVWQYQSGRNLIAARGPFARYSYLPLTPGKPFEKYGIEQQAEIVRDCFRLSRGVTVPDAPPLDVYRRLLPFEPKVQVPPLV